MMMITTIENKNDTMTKMTKNGKMPMQGCQTSQDREILKPKHRDLTYTKAKRPAKKRDKKDAQDNDKNNNANSNKQDSWWLPSGKVHDVLYKKKNEGFSCNI